MEEKTLVEALSAEALAAIHAFYNAFNTKEVNQVDDILHAHWEDIPLAPGQASGAEGYKDLVRHFVNTFPDVAVVVHEILGTHERAGVRAAMSFTHTHSFMGVQPTHKKITVALHDFHHLQNNKIIKTWHQEDWFSMLLQTGAWPVR